jgi:hypothetical protein
MPLFRIIKDHNSTIQITIFRGCLSFEKMVNILKEIFFKINTGEGGFHPEEGRDSDRNINTFLVSCNTRHVSFIYSGCN